MNPNIKIPLKKFYEIAEILKIKIVGSDSAKFIENCSMLTIKDLFKLIISLILKENSTVSIEVFKIIHYFANDFEAILLSWKGPIHDENIYNVNLNEKTGEGKTFVQFMLNRYYYNLHKKFCNPFENYTQKELKRLEFIEDIYLNKYFEYPISYIQRFIQSYKMGYLDVAGIESLKLSLEFNNNNKK